MKSKVEQVNELYDLYRTTPEGVRISEILDKIPRKCSAWMTGELDNEHSWFHLKKEILVQIIDRAFVSEEAEEPLSII